MASAASEERQKLLESVKRDVRSLLISSKSGLAISDLYRDYKSLTFDPLPFRKLGFDDARQLLLSMPDVCSCHRGPGGDIMLTAVADASTAHIEKMVQRQKPSQKRRGSRPPAYPCGMRRGVVPYNSHRSQPTTHFSREFTRSHATSIRPLVPIPPFQSVASFAAKRAASAAAKSVEEQPIPETTAGQLATMLLSYTECGIRVDEVEREFEQRTGAGLDWRRLGYRSCAAFLLAVPHVTRVVNSYSGLVAYPSRSLLAASQQLDVEEPPRRESSSPKAESGPDGAEENVDDAVEGVDDEIPSSRESPPPTPAQPDQPLSVKTPLPAEPDSRNAQSPAPASSGRSGKRGSFLATVSPVIESILKKHPNGLLCSKLVQEFRKQTGHELDVTASGYHSVLDLISKLPVKAIRYHSVGDWLLFSQGQPLPDAVYGDAEDVPVLLQELPEVRPDRLQETKQRIREILLSFPDGLRMNGLGDHYEMNFNERLPLVELGYSSVETFVLRCSGEVLQIRYTDNDIKLFPVLPNSPDKPVQQYYYPPDAVRPGQSFSRVELPDIPLEEYNLEIFVAEVYNPHKFWFHLVSPEHSEALERVMDDMEGVYYTPLGLKYRMTPETIQVGQVCACPYGEQGYHRAVITAVRTADDPVKVFYVDYGSIGSVPRKDIRFLPEKFFQLPAQALLGRLAHILPTAADGWDREASRTFLSLVDKNRILYAMVRHKTPTCVHLCLCDTNGKTDVHVNDRLVEMGHAVFRERLTDEPTNKEPIEERSRPVPVPEEPARSSPVPSSRRSSHQSAIDGLLQEAEAADDAAAQELEALIEAELAEGETRAAPAVAPVTTAPVMPTLPVLPVPGLPPGFSPLAGNAAPVAAYTSLSTAAPVVTTPATAPIVSSTALSALIGNIQMMQLQSIINPLVNPYAALLMTPAVSGLPARPVLPFGNTAQVGDIAAVATSLAASVAPNAVPSRTPAATSAGVTSPQTASAAVPSQPVGVTSQAPAASSIVMSQPLVQDAGVCVTEPVQTSSVRDLDEVDMATMNSEIADTLEQTRFVKRISIQDTFVHLINIDGTGHMVSAEISGFLWKRDILKTMLRMKNMMLPQRDLTVEEHPQLFTELVNYGVRGVLLGVDLVDPLTVYPLPTVATVFASMRNMTEVYDAKAVIEDIISQFDPVDPFWSSSIDDDLDETQSVRPPDDFPSPSIISEVTLPAMSPISDTRSPPLARRRCETSSPASVASSSHAQSTTPDSVAAQLVPEMRNIMVQLQNKRQRKVEATSLALEGSGISVESVIGEDLAEIDAQIATFYRRIQALTGNSQYSDVTLEDSLAAARHPRTSSRTTSLSMNPDAPEFVFSSGEPSVYGSPDSTICGGDALSEGGRSDTAVSRTAVSVRAADGTPVSLAQLVQKRVPIQLTSPDGRPLQLPKAAVKTEVESEKPRRPLELCTPDGQPVQLPRFGEGNGAGREGGNVAVNSVDMTESSEGGVSKRAERSAGLQPLTVSSSAAMAALSTPLPWMRVPSQPVVNSVQPPAWGGAPAASVAAGPPRHPSPALQPHSWAQPAVPPAQQPSHMVPQQPHMVPQQPHMVPQQPHMVPKQHHMVPQQPHMVPQQAHMAPQQRPQHMAPQQQPMVPHQQQPIVHPSMVPQQYPALLQPQQRYGMVYQPYQMYQQYSGYPLQYPAPMYPATSAALPRYPAP